ncbi:MAG: hypothetical protein OXB88_01755 [Bacteriovoracales bacterium]|nr:hypothetical protein [Bacteriovoracales bacterium]
MNTPFLLLVSLLFASPLFAGEDPNPTPSVKREKAPVPKVWEGKSFRTSPNTISPLPNVADLHRSTVGNKTTLTFSNFSPSLWRWPIKIEWTEAPRGKRGQDLWDLSVDYYLYPQDMILQGQGVRRCIPSKAKPAKKCMTSIFTDESVFIFQEIITEAGQIFTRGRLLDYNGSERGKWFEVLTQQQGDTE